MIYITGDTHGDFKRFKQFQKLIKRRKNYLIVCGDFGFVWDGSEQEKKVLAKFKSLDCTVLFVEGTHDNIDLLERCPVVDFCGGKARKIEENVFQLCRGEIFTIDSVSVFAFGGGHSNDLEERIEGESWWPRELPDADEIKFARDNLLAHNNEVDLVITHQRPSKDMGIAGQNKDETENVLTKFLIEISKDVKFDHWYFGGAHMDKTLSFKLTSVFENVVSYQKNSK